MKIHLPFVICAGSGDGHCRGVCTFVFLAPVDDKGRSNDEHLCCNGQIYWKWKTQFSESMELTIGKGGRHNTLAGDFCCSELTSGFWKVYTVKAGRWWPFSYAVDIVWGRSTVVATSWECGGHVDTACVGFVDVVDVCELKFSNFCSDFVLFNWVVEQKTKNRKRKK